MRHHKFTACLLVVCLASCSLPRSVDDCEAIGNDDERLTCLNHSLYGNMLQGAGIGALGGAVVGAAVGTIRGPRGVVIGALSGAGAGAIAGGAVAYFNYNRERSGGDERRMLENAVADQEAENYKFHLLSDEYEKRINNAETAVTRLQSSTPGYGSNVEELRAELARTNAYAEALTESIKLERERANNFEQYAAMTGAQKSELGDKNRALQEQISELERYARHVRDSLNAANEEIMRMRRGSALPAPSRV